MSEIRMELLAKRLGDLPLTFAHLDQMTQLYRAYEGLVAGLIAAVERDRDLQDHQLCVGLSPDVKVVLDGLQGLEAYFVGVGVDGAPAAREWLVAASAFVTAGEVPKEENR